MSRIARTPAKPSRRMVLCLGAAATAAVVAGSAGLANAPVAKADVTDTDVLTSLVGALDPSALSAADTFVGAADPAETVNAANAISYLIDAFFPSQFSATGAPQGVLGLGGYYLDTYLFGPNGLLPFVDNFLEPFVLALTGSTAADAAGAVVMGAADSAETVAAANAISYLIDAFFPSQFSATGAPQGVLGLTGYFLDNYLFGPTAIFHGVDAFLEPFVLELTGSTATEAASAAAVGAVDPVTDLFGALDPSALVGTLEPGAVLGGLDPSAFNVLDSVVDALVGTGTLF